MARSTRNSRRPSNGSRSDASVSKKRSSTSREESGLDADTRRILQRLQVGEGNQEENRNDESTSTSRTRTDQSSDASRVQGDVGTIDIEVVHETDKIRITKRDMGNGYLVNQEYLQYEPLTEQKVITHVTTVFMPK